MLDGLPGRRRAPARNCGLAETSPDRLREMTGAHPQTGRSDEQRQGALGPRSDRTCRARGEKECESISFSRVENLVRNHEFFLINTSQNCRVKKNQWKIARFLSPEAVLRWA